MDLYFFIENEYPVKTWDARFQYSAILNILLCFFLLKCA